MFSHEFATATARVADRAQVCGLIGQGIPRSLTPPMHEREGAAHGIDYTYLRFDVPAAAVSGLDLGAFLRRAGEAGMRGLNVTHPFKQSIITHLDDLSADARRLGAVNTVVFDVGRAIGHNTDWSGFARNFEASFGPAAAQPVPLDTVVQLGAGGAGSAVAYAMLTQPVRTFHIIDADATRAASLASSLRAIFPEQTIVAGSLSDASRRIADSDGVVHATPVGMADHPGVAIDPSILRPDLWVADVVYRPVVTELIATARSLGARTLTGDGMAVFQAADAFELFCGVPANGDRMLAHMKELIAAESLTPVRRSA